MKRFALHRACSFAAASVLVCSPVIAAAQSNPFVPPARGNGLSREEVAEIVRRESQRNAAANQAEPASPSAPGTPTNPPGSVSELPSQPGAPGAPGAPGPSGSPLAQTGAMPAMNGAGQMTPMGAPADPIAELLAAGGSFVGCVANTPVFKDKIGRRAYFTTKELRNSHEARRFARC